MAIQYKLTKDLSFSYIAAKKSEPTVADRGKHSVQPFGGDGPHVEAARTRDASAPLTSTPKRTENASTKNAQLESASSGLSSQGIGYGRNNASNFEAPGKLMITLTETVCST